MGRWCRYCIEPAWWCLTMKGYGKMMIDHEAWWWQSRLTWSLLVGLHVRKVRFCKELQPLCMYIYIFIYIWMELDAYWRIYWEPGMLHHDEFPKKWWGKKHSCPQNQWHGHNYTFPGSWTNAEPTNYWYCVCVCSELCPISKSWASLFWRAKPLFPTISLMLWSHIGQPDPAVSVCFFFRMAAGKYHLRE